MWFWSKLYGFGTCSRTEYGQSDKLVMHQEGLGTSELLITNPPQALTEHTPEDLSAQKPEDFD